MAMAMTASVVPLTALRPTDPHEWSASSRVSDIVPHLPHGLMATTAYDRPTRPTARTAVGATPGRAPTDRSPVADPIRATRRGEQHVTHDDKTH